MFYHSFVHKRCPREPRRKHNLEILFNIWNIFNKRLRKMWKNIYCLFFYAINLLVPISDCSIYLLLSRQTSSKFTRNIFDFVPVERGERIVVTARRLNRSGRRPICGDRTTSERPAGAAAAAAPGARYAAQAAATPRIAASRIAASRATATRRPTSSTGNYA